MGARAGCRRRAYGRRDAALVARAHNGESPRGDRARRRRDAELADRARLIVLAVPSLVVRDVVRALGPYLDGHHFIVHGVRGLVRRPDDGTGRAEQLETISDVVRDETPVRRIGALGGPALASDLLAAQPSVMVCGSRYPGGHRRVCERRSRGRC